MGALQLPVRANGGSVKGSSFSPSNNMHLFSFLPGPCYLVFKATRRRCRNNLSICQGHLFLHFFFFLYVLIIFFSSLVFLFCSNVATAWELVINPARIIAVHLGVLVSMPFPCIQMCLFHHGLISLCETLLKYNLKMWKNQFKLLKACLDSKQQSVGFRRLLLSVFGTASSAMLKRRFGLLPFWTSCSVRIDFQFSLSKPRLH